MSKDYRDLGFLSSAPEGMSIGLSCDHCKVVWTGCAAAAECPECARHEAWDAMMDARDSIQKGDEPL